MPISVCVCVWSPTYFLPVFCRKINLLIITHGQRWLEHRMTPYGNVSNILLLSFLINDHTARHNIKIYTLKFPSSSPTITTIVRVSGCREVLSLPFSQLLLLSLLLLFHSYYFIHEKKRTWAIILIIIIIIIVPFLFVWYYISLPFSTKRKQEIQLDEGYRYI